MSSGGKVKKPNYSNFMESYSSWWDINRAVVEDYSNDSFDYQRIQSDNGGDSPTQSNLTYRLQTQGNRYLVPSESYLEFDFNIKSDTAGENLANGDYFVYDGGSQFFFSEISYFIGEREVERKNYADVVEIVKRLINTPYTKQNKNNFRVQTGTAPNTFNANTLDITNTAYNKAIAKKVKGSVASLNTTQRHRIRISLKDMFEIHEYYPIAWYGQEHQLRIQLKPNNSNDIIFSGAITAAVTSVKIELNKLVLWGATVRPSSEMESKLLSMRGTNSKQLLQWEACNAYQKTFPKDQRVNWRITDASTRVQRVILMARDNAHTISQSNNSHHVSATVRPKSGIHLLYNGQKVPQIDLNNDDGNSYIRLYHEYLRCAGKGLNSMENAPLTYDEFVDNYCLICFDLSQISKDIQSFGSLATLDFSGQFNNSGGDINLTACVFQDRFMEVENGKDAQIIQDVRGIN